MALPAAIKSPENTRYLVLGVVVVVIVGVVWYLYSQRDKKGGGGGGGGGGKDPSDSELAAAAKKASKQIYKSIGCRAKDDGKIKCPRPIQKGGLGQTFTLAQGTMVAITEFIRPGEDAPASAGAVVHSPPVQTSQAPQVLPEPVDFRKKRGPDGPPPPPSGPSGMPGMPSMSGMPTDPSAMSFAPSHQADPGGGGAFTVQGPEMAAEMAEEMAKYGVTPDQMSQYGL
jgi:uncharacterized protein (UPF0333 family)